MEREKEQQLLLLWVHGRQDLFSIIFCPYVYFMETTSKGN